MSLVSNRMSSFFVDRQGNPLSMEDADRLLGNRHYAVVARTEIHESYNPWIAVIVSTVWLGVSITPDDLFETMLFPSRLGDEHIGFGDENQWRYGHEDIAALSHTQIVRGVRALFEDPVTVNIKALALMSAPSRLALMPANE